MPKVSRVAILASPAHAGEQRELRETQSTAGALGMTLLYHQVNDTADVNAAFDKIIKENANALLVFPDPVTNAHLKQITEFAAKRRFPACSDAKNLSRLAVSSPMGQSSRRYTDEFQCTSTKFLKARSLPSCRRITHEV